MLELLTKFLKENNIEIPEGTDGPGILSIMKSLIDAEGGSSEDAGSAEAGEEEAGSEENKESSKIEKPQGVA